MSKLNQFYLQLAHSKSGRMRHGNMDAFKSYHLAGRVVRNSIRDRELAKVHADDGAQVLDQFFSSMSNRIIGQQVLDMAREAHAKALANYADACEALDEEDSDYASQFWGTSPARRAYDEAHSELHYAALDLESALAAVREGRCVI